MPRTRVLCAALVAAGCIGAALALLVAYVAGAFDHKTVETRVVQTTAGASADAAWARKLYAERVPGVVTVLVVGQGGVIANGAGFVVDPVKGLIITNSHVVTNSSVKGVTPQTVRIAATVYIQRADSAREPATILGYDLFDDIAVLHYDPRVLHLGSVPLGHSATVHIGDPVAAIGAPFGQVESLSVGVVSQVGTQIIAPATVCFRTTDAIQTDAAINPGNSGGPLFNSAGQVIGVTSQIDAGASKVGSGVAFAVPVDAVRRSLQQITATRTVQYPFLGVGANTLTPDIVAAYHLKARYGAQVAFVDPNSAAAKAGLSAGLHPVAVDGRQVHVNGDVIVEFAGKPVRTLTDLQHDVAIRRPGDRVEIGWYHGSTLKHASIVLGEASPKDPDVCAASAGP
jgi:2-alkenal reductase